MSGILNRLLVLMLSLAAGVCIAQSGAFPVKPVRFVVGFTPGGPSDILARALGQKLGELFRAMAGVEMVHVPYKGAQPALTDVIAGQAQLMFATSASAVRCI